MEDKEAVAEVKDKLLELTGAFCREHLDDEYRRLSVKLIEKLARKRPPPILRGRLENWAAGVIHALGSVNFLFDKSFPPYVASPDIAAYFGVAPSTMAQKSKVIRDLFKMDRLGSQEFATAHIKEGFAPLGDMIRQLAGIMVQDEAPLEPGEFVDDDHPLMDDFYEVADRFETRGPSKAIQTALEKMIARDPDFYDPYLVLADLFTQTGQGDEADRLRDEAYRRALARITAATGEWPERLEWGWIENRHLIRALLNKALDLWDRGETPAALDLLQRLLHSNPQDNIGARHFILAIRLGMTREDFEAKFNKGGFYDADLPTWFDRHMSEFPDDFDWWKKVVEYD